jgi:hypothetical protein
MAKGKPEFDAVELEGSLKKIATGRKLGQDGLPEVTLQLVLEVGFDPGTYAALGKIVKENLQIVLEPLQVALPLSEPKGKRGKKEEPELGL